MNFTRDQKLRYLEEKHGLSIKYTKHQELEDVLEILTVRKPQVSQTLIKGVAMNLIEKDTNQGKGPGALKSMLQNELILIPWDQMRALVRALAPEGFLKRQPGSKQQDIARVALVSIGLFHEVSADGHEKLNGQALRMGDISLPIYGYHDKWSGYLLKLLVLPDSRNAAPLAHVYLDLIEQYGGIPMQLTTDKGSEQAWQHSIQDAFRHLLAPQIDPEVYPTCVGLKSPHNTVIESLWNLFQKHTGKTPTEAILKGQELHIFQPGCFYHGALFYWVFIPLIQGTLKKFRDHWNYHHVRPQPEKVNPSGHVPAVVFESLEKYDPDATHCIIQVPQDMIDDLCRHLEAHPDIGGCSQFFQWYSGDFNTIAQQAYEAIGSPDINIATTWEVFRSMSEPIKNLLI
ncbi:hypothetical protein H1R20_g959, partial [Candolleomyces eurysporus]